MGVCGTDREICTFAYGQPPAGGDYLLLGHECLGEVVEVGSAVKNFKPGDLVVPSVRRPCTDPNCRPCREGRQDFCFTWKFTERGINQRHGFMTECFVEEERLPHARAAGTARRGRDGRTADHRREGPGAGLAGAKAPHLGT